MGRPGSIVMLMYCNGHFEAYNNGYFTVYNNGYFTVYNIWLFYSLQ